MKPKLLFLLLLLLPACEVGNLVEPTVEIGEAFWLRYGESKKLLPDSLSVAFQGLLAEGRCPLEVICVWEGRADIRLQLAGAGRDTSFVALRIPGFATRVDTLAHMPVDTLGYQFTLIQLDPYPHAGQPPVPTEYKALLRITRLLR